MFKLIEDPMTLFSTAITWILHTFIDKPHTLFVVLLYAVLMSVNGLEVTYDITTFNGWELLTTLPYNASAVTPFKIITDSGKCHAATPCIQVTGAEGLYDVWIQRDVLAEGWSNMMLMYDLHTMSLDIETDEHAFVAAICDGGGEIRYRTPSVSDMANFTGALDLSSQICNVLTIRIGGYMNGGWDFVWIQSVKIEYATSSPTLSPTAYPTNGPSTYPSGPPSVSPSRSPSRNPSFPSSEPSRSPTPKPTAQPSSSPSADPTTHPTANPSLNPSIHPTTQPSKYPSANPSTYPTVSPSDQPTNTPTLNPSIPPTHLPTVNPSVSPTNNPTATPSDIPSVHPTSTPSQPTTFPTRSPSYDPSRNPTMFPTKSPSFNPTAAPTSNPTLNPSGDPTKLPTRSPTKSPSSDPTVGPTSDPSRDPTTFPTSAPSDPTSDPTSHPSGNPTMFPTKAPSSNPTTFPTRAPSTPSQPPSLASIDPTVLPTRTPSNNPTLTSTVPTMTPTKTPTYATPVITACSYGTLRFCYYVDIAPVPGIVQSRLISIQDVDRTNSVSTFYDIYVTPTTHHCVDPSVTVTYESIDYDSGGISEGFGVIRPDGTTIITCSSTNACGSFASCVTNQNVGITMLPADESNLLVTLSVAYQVDDFCTGSPSYHNYVINARLTIFCSDATAPPTTDPTVLTVSPTHAPSAAPTLAPSSAPTYPTNAPTSTPTDTTEYPTVNPTADPTQPTTNPSNIPTINPTSRAPSLTPTAAPSDSPTQPGLEWIVLDTALSPQWQSAIGLYRNNVWLVGGLDNTKSKLVEFDIYANTHVDVSNALPSGFRFYTKSYCQIGDILYLYPYSKSTQYIWTFDLNSTSFSSAAIPVHNTGIWWLALCSFGTRFLLQVGGRSEYGSMPPVDDFSIYDLFNNEWITGPELTNPIRSSSCIVVNNGLYIVGGSDAANDPLDTVITMDLTYIGDNLGFNDWIYLNDKLRIPKSNVALINHNDNIYVIGGYSTDIAWTSDVEVIDTTTGSIYFDSNLISPGATQILSAKLVDDRLFVFMDTMVPVQYALVPSLAPTQQPSVAPSIAPSGDPTTDPSIHPTKYPSEVPTVDTTSRAPSRTHTAAPSHSPTQSTIQPTTAQPTTGAPTVMTSDPTTDPSGDSTTSPIRSPSSVPSQLPSLTPTDNPVPAPSISAFGTEVCVHLDPNTNNNAGFEKLMISPPQSMAEHYFQFTVSLIDSQNRDGAAIVLLSEWSNYTKWQIILGHGENDYHIRQLKYDPDVPGYATYVGERIYNGDVFRTGMTASFWISWDNGIMKIGGGDIVLQDEYLSWGTVDVVEYIWLATYHSDTACYVYDENASSLAPSIPSQPPTGSTSFVPSKNPTDDPFIDPTIGPSIDPTADPTIDPTIGPSIDPTTDPTVDPTIDPTTDPTVDPTIDPTADPTIDPTIGPS
eukprot:190028_1